MATVSGPVKQPTNPKNDAFVDAQIERAQRRIRALDLLTAFLGFLAGTLAFGLQMAVLDAVIGLPTLVRRIGLGVYLVGAAIYLGYAVVRPLTRRINPYFAARKVEETIPDAKNSVVNWLDLHDDERLPGPIQHAVSQRAARDLARVDMDQALSARGAGYTGGVAGVLLAVFLILPLLLGGYPKFLKHFGKAFFLFEGDARSTQLTLEQPVGDVTVSAEQPLEVRVRVGGKIPPSIRLLTRPTLEDPERPWSMEEVSRDDRSLWSVTIPPASIQNGFYFRVVGGDATTETFRVSVRASPAIDNSRFLARYTRRAYTGTVIERVERGQRDLNDLRGTEVRLEVRTNRALKSGELEFYPPPAQEEKGASRFRRIRGETDANDPQRMRFKMVLEESGKYVLRFTSTEDELFSDSLPHVVTARPDKGPEVEFVKPAQDVAEAPDGRLELIGFAKDDVGVKELTLRIQVVNGELLAPIPYRNDAEIKLADGGYPHLLDYLHSLDLAKLIDKEGRPYPLKDKQVLEYWLEARDACDFPAANVGESKRYRITIVGKPMKSEQEKAADQKKAEQKQQEHQKQQDQKRRQEQQQRQEQAKQEKERQEQAQKDQERKDKDDKGEKGEKGDKGDKEGEKKEPGDKQGEKDKPDGDGKGKENADQNRKDDETKEKKDRLDDAVRKHEAEKEAGKGKGDPANEKRGEGKEGDKPEQKPDDKQKDNQGSGKEGQQPDQKPGEGKQGKPEQQPGESKDGKADDAMKDKQATGKEGGQKQERGEGKGKPEPQPQQGEKGKEGGQPKGEGKPSPQKDAGDKAGEKKDGQQAEGMKEERSQGKGGDPKGEQQKQGEGKGEPKKTESAGGKGKDGQPKEQTAGQAKQGPKDEKQNQAAENKGGGQGDKDKPAEKKDFAAGKDDGKKEERAAQEASKEDVDKLKKDLESRDEQKRDQAKRELKRISQECKNGEVRQAAENEVEKLKDADRKEAAEGVKKLLEDLKSEDAKRREQAQKQLKEIARKAKETKPEDNQEQQPKELPPDLKDALEKLKNESKDNDPKKAEAAQKALKDLEDAAKEAEQKQQPPPQGNAVQEFIKEYLGGRGRTTDDKDGKAKDPKSDNRHLREASDLKLRKFSEVERKKILEEAGLTEKDVRDVGDLLKRRPELKDGPDGVAKQEPGKALPQTGIGGPIKTGDGAKDVSGSDRGLPPAEYRDAFKKFSQRFSESQKKDK